MKNLFKTGAMLLCCVFIFGLTSCTKEIQKVGDTYRLNIPTKEKKFQTLSEWGGYLANDNGDLYAIGEAKTAAIIGNRASAGEGFWLLTKGTTTDLVDGNGKQVMANIKEVSITNGIILKGKNGSEGAYKLDGKTKIANGYPGGIKILKPDVLVGKTNTDVTITTGKGKNAKTEKFKAQELIVFGEVVFKADKKFTDYKFQTDEVTVKGKKEKQEFLYVQTAGKTWTKNTSVNWKTPKAPEPVKAPAKKK